jgi:hypothetical protein
MRQTKPAFVGVGVDCLVESEVAAVDSDNTHVDSKASRQQGAAVAGSAGSKR